ncbi:MAG TPA: nitroreductase family protein [Balneolaceae bacterium]|nr:nitroreductase family protein [Balneolaceae bacterium]
MKDKSKFPVKEANTSYDIHPLIKKRWSPRTFSDKPVDKEILRQIFDAARWAPSSYNEQPWRFIIATKEEPEEFEKLSKVMVEFNRNWASGAPVLILTAIKKIFEKNGKPNRVALHDLGQAASYLTFEATRHNLYVHQMAGIDLDKARELFNIPEDYEPATMIAIGYIGELDNLPKNLKDAETGERSRLDIDEILFRGDWESKKPL